MSWRDTIKRQSVGGVPLVGSFRGARFIVPTADGVAGRRTEVHEYPLRDDAYVEDLGQATGRFTVEVFVDSSLVQSGDYTEARDALIAALNTSGSATLVHPWYGRKNVGLAEPASYHESSREGGRATFRITFVEDGGLIYPTSGQDTAWKTQAAADSATAAAVADFAAVFSVDGQPAFFLTAIEDELTSVLGQVEQTVGDIAAAVAAEIRAPYNMASAIVGAISNVANRVTEPMRALQLYQGMFSTGSSSASVPTTTANRKQQARNTAALHTLIQRSAIIEAARTASATDFATRNDALAIRDALASALDTQMEVVDPVSGAPADDTIYHALQDLRAAMANDLRTRGARLPELVTHTLRTTLPALVVAYNVYGDASRDADLISRNNIRHPGFVPGGEPLEVLATDGLMSRSAGRAGGTLNV